MSQAGLAPRRAGATSRLQESLSGYLFSLPSAVGLYLLAEPITLLLFNNAEAGYSLAVMSWSVIPLCLYVSTTGVMQGLGRPIIPVLNMVYGGLVKTVLAWYLTAIPTLHVGGAALASVLGMGVAAVFNLYYVARYTGWRFRTGELLLLPGIAAAAMSAAVYLSNNFIFRLAVQRFSQGAANAVATLVSIFLGIAVYGIALLLTGGIRRDELTLLPGVGQKLVDLAVRFRLLRR